MMRNKCCCLQKVLCAMIAVLLLTVSLTGGAFAQEKEYAFTYRSGSYAAYDQQHAALPVPMTEIRLDGPAGEAADDVRCSIQTIDGRNALVWDDQKGSVTWRFAVEEAGRYALELDYYALPGVGNIPEYELCIDGEVPFIEAQQLQLTRLYQDAVNVFAQDNMGNDLRPSQEEVYTWQTSDLYDVNGYVNGSYLFALDAGDHTLTLTAIREPVAIASLCFHNVQEAPTYEDYSAAHTLW